MTLTRFFFAAIFMLGAQLSMASLQAAGTIGRKSERILDLNQYYKRSDIQCWLYKDGDERSRSDDRRCANVGMEDHIRWGVIWPCIVCGGGDFKLECRIKGVSREQVASGLAQIWRETFGPMASVSSTDERGYNLKAINIRFPKERIFLKVLGSEEKSAAPRNIEANKEELGVTFGMQFDFTVSTRSSDRVTDYREPNEGQSQRIAVYYYKLLAEKVTSTYQPSECGFEFL